MGFSVGSNMPFEVILVRKTPPTNLTLMPYTHVPIFVVIPVLPDRVKTLITLLAAMPELVQVAQHVLFHVLLVHESSETEVAYGPVRVLRKVVLVEFTVLVEGGTANVTAVHVALALLYVPEEHEFVDEQLFAAEAFVVDHVDFLGWVQNDVVGGGEIGYFVAPLGGEAVFRRGNVRGSARRRVRTSRDQ